MTDPGAACRAEILPDWRSAARLAAAAGLRAPTPFQSERWLGAWHATLGEGGEVSPLPVAVREAATGEPLLLLPLVLRHADRRRVVEFADRGVTDYNAPSSGGGRPARASCGTPCAARCRRPTWRP